MNQRDQNGIDGLKDMVEYIIDRIPKKYYNICEIGSFQGESTKIFALFPPIEQIVCVDPLNWESVKNDPDCKDNKEFFNDIEYRFWENIGIFNNKIRLIRKTSRNAVGAFPPEFFDFVYIDGDHRYEEVVHDIKYWLPTIKKPGYICGHDWTGRRSVYDAVKSIIGWPDCVFLDSSWCKKVC